MGEKRCRHYELRIFPEKELDLERSILPAVSPGPMFSIEQFPKIELFYVVLKGDITRKMAKRIYGKSWIREQKTADGTKYVCACCGQEFAKADAGRMDEIVDRYVSGNGFDSRAVYSEMRRIKTLYWEDGRREKANFRTEEPAIICGPYETSDLHNMKLTDFFCSQDISMSELSKIQFVKEEVPYIYGIFPDIPILSKEDLEQEVGKEFVWHEALGTFLSNKNSWEKYKGEKKYEQNGRFGFTFTKRGRRW
ncbi:MAG: hypothetical protein MRZ93_04230 [Lachnospiraceae bacterium]|nr:hypothetical protein [Lachnospiraceae bacterium]